MPLTIGFDTSTGTVCAALVSGGVVLAEASEDMAKGQAERLVPMLEEILAAQDANWADVERIGVGIGPGNFTGIRIAVSAARGLAMARAIPAIGVSMFEARALGTRGALRVVLDAKRDHLYVQDFLDEAANGTPALIEAGALDSMPVQSKLVADAGLLDPKDGSVVQPRFSTAAAIARIAETAKDHGRPAPLYIRAPDAAPSKIQPPTILS